MCRDEMSLYEIAFGTICNKYVNCINFLDRHCHEKFTLDDYCCLTNIRYLLLLPFITSELDHEGCFQEMGNEMKSKNVRKLI